ncbi:MAG: electron transfer flavoprotein subunit alpha/FixB family protein, partial [Arthrobacter sp.]
MTEFASDSILVLLDTLPGGGLAKSSAGLLGAAEGIGTPVALLAGNPAELVEAAEAAAALGAARVLTADISAAGADMTVPVVDALEAAAALAAPDAVLVSNSVEGRDVAGRYAVRAGTALAVDAVGLSRDAEGIVALHSVYGGEYLAESALT